MGTNRGKQFEDIIKSAFLKVPEVSIDRLHDQTNGYRGSSNICDFIVYKKPYEYYIECKSVHGNTLSISGNDFKHKHGNITNVQWDGLLEKCKIQGVHGGIICWFITKDTTKYFPIEMLQDLYEQGRKSVRFDEPDKRAFNIDGVKKRVFFNYDMDSFFHKIDKQERSH